MFGFCALKLSPSTFDSCQVFRTNKCHSHHGKKNFGRAYSLHAQGLCKVNPFHKPYTQISRKIRNFVEHKYLFCYALEFTGTLFTVVFAPHNPSWDSHTELNPWRILYVLFPLQIFPLSGMPSEGASSGSSATDSSPVILNFKVQSFNFLQFLNGKNNTWSKELHSKWSPHTSLAWAAGEVAHVGPRSLAPKPSHTYTTLWGLTIVTQTHPVFWAVFFQRNVPTSDILVPPGILKGAPKYSPSQNPQKNSLQLRLSPSLSSPRGCP